MGVTLPTIGKSKSTGNTGHRGTMAALFDDLVSDEELLTSQTPKGGKRFHSSEEEMQVDRASTTPEHSNKRIEDKNELRTPIPPESPVPSKNFDRSRSYSAEKEKEAFTKLCQKTAGLAIDVGMSKMHTISHLSQMTACSVIDIGLASRKTEDENNDYDLNKPGSIESLLASTVTKIALDNALKKLQPQA